MQAIAALSAPVTRINDLLFTKQGKKQQGRLQQVAALSAGVTATFQLLGLPVTDAAASMEVLHTTPRLLPLVMHPAPSPSIPPRVRPGVGAHNTSTCGRQLLDAAGPPQESLSVHRA